MAPKNKFTREEMVAAAVRVVQKMGAAALTAKSLAEELGTSTQPVFTCFGTMDTAKAEVYDAAEQAFDEYLTEGLKQEIPFFGIGTQYIRFAREEPELYRLLFLMRSDDRGSDAFAAMRHIIYCDFEKLFQFKLGEESLPVLAHAAEQYLLCQVERILPALNFYKTICI